MLSVTHKPFMLSVIMLNVVMLNVVMLSVVMLGVGMLSVVAPFSRSYDEEKSFFCHFSTLLQDCKNMQFFMPRRTLMKSYKKIRKLPIYKIHSAKYWGAQTS